MSSVWSFEALLLDASLPPARLPPARVAAAIALLTFEPVLVHSTSMNDNGVVRFGCGKSTLFRHDPNSLYARLQCASPGALSVMLVEGHQLRNSTFVAFAASSSIRFASAHSGFLREDLPLRSASGAYIGSVGLCFRLLHYLPSPLASSDSLRLHAAEAVQAANDIPTVDSAHPNFRTDANADKDRDAQPHAAPATTSDNHAHAAQTNDALRSATNPQPYQEEHSKGHRHRARAHASRMQTARRASRPSAQALSAASAYHTPYKAQPLTSARERHKVVQRRRPSRSSAYHGNASNGSTVCSRCGGQRSNSQLRSYRDAEVQTTSSLKHNAEEQRWMKQALKPVVDHEHDVFEARRPAEEWKMGDVDENGPAVEDDRFQYASSPSVSREDEEMANDESWSKAPNERRHETQKFGEEVGSSFELADVDNEEGQYSVSQNESYASDEFDDDEEEDNGG